MSSFLDRPWEGRRSPFTIRGRSGESFGSLTAVGISADSMATNYTLTPHLDQSRDGNYQGGVPLAPTLFAAFGTPSGQVTINLGTVWIGAVYDQDQQPQYGIQYSIKFDQTSPIGVVTEIVRDFTVNESSHPANTYANNPPFTHYYISEVFPWISPSGGAYEYTNFRIVTVSLPPYYNP